MRESRAPRGLHLLRTGKIILQRAIEKEQVQKLLTSGRTDLLEKFISKKGRPFKAFLALGPESKVGFEFEPRAKKTPGAAKPKEPAPKVDFTKAEPVAECPVCGGRVLETGTELRLRKIAGGQKAVQIQGGQPDFATAD